MRNFVKNKLSVVLCGVCGASKAVREVCKSILLKFAELDPKNKAMVVNRILSLSYQLLFQLFSLLSLMMAADAQFHMDNIAQGVGFTQFLWDVLQSLPQE
jgi:hypothetical protein